MRFNVFAVSLLICLFVPQNATAQEGVTLTDAPAAVSVSEAVSASDAATLAMAVSPVSPEDPGALLTAAAGAAASSQWVLFAGFFLMLGVWALKKVAPQLPSKALPWVAMGTSVATYLALSLQQGGDWKTAVLQGLLSGVAAVGLWEMVAKHLFAPKA